MDKFPRVYLNELRTQCDFAENAANQIRILVSVLNEHPEKSDIDQEIFRNIHSFLSHAAIISKLLWPAQQRPIGSEHSNRDQFRKRKEHSKKRGEELRSILNIPDEGHILQDRTLRNYLEHYDEHLDHWVLNSKTRVIIGHGYGDISGVTGLDATDYMRWFDPKSGEFIFRGEKFNIFDIDQAIHDLKMIIPSLTFKNRPDFT